MKNVILRIATFALIVAAAPVYAAESSGEEFYRLIDRSSEAIIADAMAVIPQRFGTSGVKTALLEEAIAKGKEARVLPQNATDEQAARVLLELAVQASRAQ